MRANILKSPFQVMKRGGNGFVIPLNTSSPVVLNLKFETVWKARSIRGSYFCFRVVLQSKPDNYSPILSYACLWLTKDKKTNLQSWNINISSLFFLCYCGQQMPTRSIVTAWWSPLGQSFNLDRFLCLNVRLARFGIRQNSAILLADSRNIVSAIFVTKSSQSMSKK